MMKPGHKQPAALGVFEVNPCVDTIFRILECDSEVSIIARFNQIFRAGSLAYLATYLFYGYGGPLR